jgi:phospholipase D1/2
VPPALQKWLPAIAIGAALLLLAAAWRYAGVRELIDLDQIATAVEPYRTSWYSLPATVLVFVVAELVLFPVLLLIFACGIVFGPWLGALHAMAGALASALIPFAIGRRLGHATVLRRGGVLAERVDRVLARRGVIAVFLVRKIPAPFTLVNVVCGASRVSWGDFVLGTVLGMGTGVILITVLGGQLMEIARSADAGRIVIALGMLFAPLVLALLLQRLLNRWAARRAGQQR